MIFLLLLFNCENTYTVPLKSGSRFYLPSREASVSGHGVSRPATCQSGLRRAGFSHKYGLEFGMSRSATSSIFFLSLNEEEKRGAKVVLERAVWLKLKGRPSRRDLPGILPAQNFHQPYTPTVPHEVGQSFAERPLGHSSAQQGRVQLCPWRA